MTVTVRWKGQAPPEHRPRQRRPRRRHGQGPPRQVQPGRDQCGGRGRARRPRRCCLLRRRQQRQPGLVVDVPPAKAKASVAATLKADVQEELGLRRRACRHSRHLRRGHAGRGARPVPLGYPRKGGAFMTRGDGTGSCTTGFTVLNSAGVGKILSAAHCDPLGDHSGRWRQRSHRQRRQCHLPPRRHRLPVMDPDGAPSDASISGRGTGPHCWTSPRPDQLPSVNTSAPAARSAGTIAASESPSRASHTTAPEERASGAPAQLLRTPLMVLLPTATAADRSTTSGRPTAVWGPAGSSPAERGQRFRAHPCSARTTAAIRGSSSPRSPASWTTGT